MQFRDEAEQQAERAAGSRSVQIAARVGLAGNGLLHLVVAWLAARVASGAAERADQAGALATIATEPGGRLLLAAVAFGFAATVVRLLRLALNSPRRRERPRLERTRRERPRRERPRRERLAALGEAVVFAGLGVLAVRAAAGAGAGSGGTAATALVLRLPGGRAAVVVAGVAVLVGGVVMVVRGIRLDFTDELDLTRAGPLTRQLVLRTGQFGKLAKGIAIAVIGLLVGVAATTYQPAKAEGLDAALKAVAAQPFGAVALFVVAVGLAIFGIFCFFEARYRSF